MVLTWNSEPSRAQGYAYPSSQDLGNANHKAAVFLESNRFVRDSTREDRIPNFVNTGPADPQGNERSNVYIERNTNTHTVYADRLASTRAVLELAEQVASSLWSPPTMKSARVKSATNKTLLSNDTRFEVLRDSCGEDLGPGCYWLEGGAAGMGLLLPEQPSRGHSPARDPCRMSQPFLSPHRPEVFTPSPAPDRMYMDPGWQPQNDKSVAWDSNAQQDVRPCVQDYRYNTRLKEATKQVPLDAEYPACSTINQSSHLVCIGDTAQRGASPTHTFRTKEARLVPLPKERLNDVRLSRPRGDEDPSSLGPGTYTPFISLGAARRKTYRLFAPQQPNGVIGQPGGVTYQQRFSRVGGVTAGDRGGGSSAFQASPRGRKSGPFTWATDSKLVRH